jgi:hypothetical protein
MEVKQRTEKLMRMEEFENGYAEAGCVKYISALLNLAT